MFLTSVPISSAVNGVGVILVTCGAWLLWQFIGEVASVDKAAIARGDTSGVAFTIPHYTPELRKKVRRDMLLTRAGKIFTLSGGLLQLLASFMT